jgi:hypothetical protein
MEGGKVLAMMSEESMCCSGWKEDLYASSLQNGEGEKVGA